MFTNQIEILDNHISCPEHFSNKKESVEVFMEDRKDKEPKEESCLIIKSIYKTKNQFQCVHV